MTPKGFEYLKVQVFDVPEGQDIIKYFRDLSDFEAFSLYSGKDRNEIVKYVIFAYDPSSPCVRNNSADLTKRKEAAAELAGYKRLKSGKFDASVIEMFNMKNSAVTDMICCYLRYFVNNRVWSLITVNEQILSEYIKLLMDPVSKGDGDDKKLLEAANTKSKLREECKSIVSDLEKQYKELYGDNEDLKEAISKPIKPETMLSHV
jgi:hypothetical protein